MQRYLNRGRTGPPWLYPSNGDTSGSSSRFAGDFDENGACSGSAPSYQLYCKLRLTADYANHDSTHAKGIAWAEGFADAFALRALATRPGGFETSIFSFQSATGSAWSHDFEAKPASASQQVEHAVAASLWDLSDSWADGLDTYAGGFQRVWQAFTFAQTNTFRGFWDNWMAALHSEEGQVVGGREAMAQNGFVTSRSTLNAPTSFNIGPDYVRLCWTTASPADLLKIEVHKSTTPNFLPTSATRWTTITDTRTCQDVTGLTQGVTYHFKLYTYSLSGFPSHSNQVIATTIGTPSTIEGFVKNSGGTPIGGARVIFTFPSGATQLVYTDSVGYYSLQVGVLGTYRLAAEAAGYTPTSCFDWLNVNQYNTVYRRDFTLVSGTGIAPICVDMGVQGAQVTVTNSAVVVYSAPTDANGRVPGIMGLAPGTYKITATWNAGKCRYAGTVYVTIPPGQGPTIEMRLDSGDNCPVLPP